MDCNGNTTVNTWVNDLLIATTTPRGFTTTYEYDYNRRLVAVYDALSGGGFYYYTSYSYDAAGNLEETIDNNGNSTGYTYDALGRLTLVVDDQGYYDQTGYTPSGLVFLHRDKRGDYDRHLYDTRG